MSSDLYKQVLFSDGEGLTHTDFNDAQRFLESKLSDQVLDKLIAGIAQYGQSDLEFPSVNAGNAPTRYAYALTVGGACPQQGSSANKVRISAGTLYQKIATSTGNDPTVLGFTFAGTDEFTIANGNGVNPRIDIVQMKLEYENADSQSRDFEDGTSHVITTTTPLKKRRVKCTLSVKQGTAAASPAYPLPDAGYVPVCALVINASYAGAAFKFTDTSLANAMLHDLRVPLGVKAYRVPLRACHYDASKWIPVTLGNKVVATSGPVGDFIAPCPVSKGRILAVGIGTKNANGCTGTLSRYSNQLLAVAGSYLATAAGLRDILDTTGTYKFQKNGFGYWDNTVASGPVPDDATNPGSAEIAVPVWCQGTRAPTELFAHAGSPDQLSADDDSCIALVISGAPNTMEIYSVTFWVAEGLA